VKVAPSNVCVTVHSLLCAQQACSTGAQPNHDQVTTDLKLFPTLFALALKAANEAPNLMLMGLIAAVRDTSSSELQKHLWKGTLHCRLELPARLQYNDTKSDLSSCV
jgi:hypothetical protein